jgi:hypothetical protein
VERYFSESAVSVALQQCSYVLVSLSAVHSVQFVGDVFYKKKMELSKWPDSVDSLGGIQVEFFADEFVGYCF